MKKLLRNRGVSSKGGGEGGPLKKRRISKLFHQSFLRINVFITIDFFGLVSVDACCSEQIYSFTWFTFYQKMIYYEISFLITLISNYNFVKILLLMTFISISISYIKLQIFLKINRRCLKEVIEQLLYIMIFIIMNLKFK